MCQHHVCKGHLSHVGVLEDLRYFANHLLPVGIYLCRLIDFAHYYILLLYVPGKGRALFLYLIARDQIIQRNAQCSYQFAQGLNCGVAVAIFYSCDGCTRHP